MLIRSLLTAILFLTGLALLGPQSALAEIGTIQGTITDTGSDLPIENAMVAVSDPSGGRHTSLGSGTTDVNGDYSIDIDMAAGTTIDVIVEAAGPGHAPGRHAWTDPLGCFFNCGGSGGEVTVTEGTTQSGIDIALNPGGTISGTITAADTGSALENATVRMIQAGGSDYSPHFHGTADALGDYTTPLALPLDDFYVLAYPPQGDNYVVTAWDDIDCQLGAGCPILDTDPVTVPETGIDFALAAGATIEGSLFPDTIDRIVRLYDGSGKALDANYFWDFGLTGDQWSFTGLSGGSYYVELGPFSGQNAYLRILQNGLLCPFGGCDRARGAPITIPPGSSLSLASINLDEGGQVGGTIVDAATGSAPTGVPAGTRLGFYDVIEADGTVVGGGLIEESAGEVVLKQSAGIPAGDYYVRTWSEWLGDGIGFSPSGTYGSIAGYTDSAYPDVACAGKRCDLSGASTVSVTAGTSTSIQIEIATGSNISGRITDQDTSNGVAEVVVKLVDDSNGMLAATLTDGNGDYQFGAFPAGSYYVRTSAAGRFGEGHNGVQNAYFDRVYGATGNCSERLCEPTDGTAITLDGSSDATGIDIAIESGPVISGQIIYAISGLPINRGHVEVYDDSGDQVGEYRLASHLDARYQTTALAPGDYTLVPVVSPAYSDVSTSGGSSVSSTTLARGERSGHKAMTVTVGSDSVEADLRVIDDGLDILFQDGFADE